MNTKLFKRGCLLIVIVLLISGLSSCSKCDDGSGIVLNENRNLSNFVGIAVDDRIDVTVFQDTAYSVRVSADDNKIFELITLVDEQGILQIYGGERCLRKASIKTVAVGLPNITYLSVSGNSTLTGVSRIDGENIVLQVNGSGFIQLDSIFTTTLSSEIYDGGNMRLGSVNSSVINSRVDGNGLLEIQGETISHDIELYGLGTFSGFGLQTQFSDVSINGTENAEVNVSSQLDVFINGPGNVYFIGFPYIIDTNIIGTGGVFDVN